MNDLSIQDILGAKRNLIYCENFQPCSKGKPSVICCLSCEEFKECQEVCYSAKNWDVHLVKCEFAKGDVEGV